MSLVFVHEVVSLSCALSCLLWYKYYLLILIKKEHYIKATKTMWMSSFPFKNTFVQWTILASKTGWKFCKIHLRSFQFYTFMLFFKLPTMTQIIATKVQTRIWINHPAISQLPGQILSWNQFCNEKKKFFLMIFFPTWSAKTQCSKKRQCEFNLQLILNVLNCQSWRRKRSFLVLVNVHHHNKQDHL